MSCQAQGICEIGNEIPCAWQDIYERLKEQNRVDDILKIKTAMQWQNQTRRMIVQDEYAGRYEDKK